MDKAALVVGPDLEGGERLLARLRASGVTVTAALWQWNELLEKWELVLALPLVEEVGLKESYMRVRRALMETEPPTSMKLADISIFTPQSTFVKDLRRAFRKQKNQIVGKQYIGDHTLDRGFIYFVN
jgi:hypothetical protein